MRLGNFTVEPTVSRQERLTMLIWGKPGCGKTVLAATAPGKKLWLQFDPSGTASLRRTDDIFVADFSAMKDAQMEMFKQGNIIEQDLLKLIKDNSIETVVVDSITSFGQKALSYGIVSGKANRGTFRASIEMPGQTGYGIRSSMILDFCTMVIRVCGDTKTHCIFTAHDQDTLNNEGHIVETTLSLGGQGKNLVPSKISEIWHMEDTGKQRLIYVRTHGVKKPMRTRMFVVPEGVASFPVKYNVDTHSGDGIAEWYSAWLAASYNRVPLPK